MPFEHAATTQWGRWLRRVFAGRPPGTQVVGQEVEDSLRATIQVADLAHLTTPIGWAQAATRRRVNAVAAQVSRIELHCQSPGGLWVDVAAVLSVPAIVRVLDAPLTTPTRGGVQDFGNIPTVSLVGGLSIAEAAPAGDLPTIAASAAGTFWGVHPLFCPFGKVVAFLAATQNSTLIVDFLSWREIPSPTQ